MRHPVQQYDKLLLRWDHGVASRASKRLIIPNQAQQSIGFRVSEAEELFMMGIDPWAAGLAWRMYSCLAETSGNADNAGLAKHLISSMYLSL